MLLHGSAANQDDELDDEERAELHAALDEGLAEIRPAAASTQTRCSRRSALMDEIRRSLRSLTPCR
jgi:hypothetical protein